MSAQAVHRGASTSVNVLVAVVALLAGLIGEFVGVALCLAALAGVELAGLRRLRGPVLLATGAYLVGLVLHVIVLMPSEVAGGLT